MYDDNNDGPTAAAPDLDNSDEPTATAPDLDNFLDFLPAAVDGVFPRITEDEIELACAAAATMGRSVRNAAAHLIKDECEARHVPQNIGDVRGQIREIASRMAQLESSGDEGNPVSVMPINDGDCMRMAEVFLREVFHHKDAETLSYWREDFYIWKKSHWCRVEEMVVIRALLQWMRHQQISVVTTEGMSSHAMKTTSHQQNNIMNSLKAVTLREADANVGWDTKCELDAPDRIVPCRDGLLHTDTLELHPHTPLLFNLHFVDASWGDGKAGPKELEGTTFQGFLNNLCEDNPEQERSLRQAIGYMLTPRTEQDKMFLTVGKGRSGKGTLMRLFKSMIGTTTASMLTSAFANDFGLEPLLGKSVLFLPDVRMDGNTDFASLAEKMLSITGRDEVTVNRKGKTMLAQELPLRIWVAANLMPQYRDASGVLSERFVVFRFDKSFLGKEDRALGDKLVAERDVIFRWAMGGVQDLDVAGGFSLSDDQQQWLKDAKAAMSPMRTFFDEHIEVTEDGGDHVYRDEFQIAFRYWAYFTKRLRLWKPNMVGNDINKMSDVPVDVGQVSVISRAGNSNQRTYKRWKWREGKRPTMEEFKLKNAALQDVDSDHAKGIGMDSDRF